MYLQMARARGSFAVPEKTFTVYLISLQNNKILRKARGKCQPAHYQRKCLKQVETSVKNHNSRKATVIGRRAARIAGNNPPITPITAAHKMPRASKAGVTLKANVS